MSYFIAVCAVSCHADRYIWTIEGTAEEVKAHMASEQGRSVEYITDNYEIEECSVYVPDELVHQIVQDHKRVEYLEKCL
jgi:hypothetical protein